MMIDAIDSRAIGIDETAFTKQLAAIHRDFRTRIKPAEGYYMSMDSSADDNIARAIGIDKTAVERIRPTIMESVKEALYGVEKDGFHTLGLEEVASWKRNSTYYSQNTRQQAGYAAEIISTMKENLIARAEGSDIRTYRADDLPAHFKRNDQYVDKVRMTPDGTIVERIQSKFVGGSGEEWLSKFLSKKFDKYYDGHVDKFECPKNYYDDVMKEIQQRRESLLRQLESVKAQGKEEVVLKKQAQLDKLNKLESMVEKSTVTSDEAIFARNHPKAYAAKIFASETLKVSNSEGIKNGAMAAGITFTVSIVNNVKALVGGELDAKEMTINVFEDTASAGALGYGTVFVSTAVSQAMKGASSQLIRSVGNSCLPAAVVSFAVESYDEITEFAQGKIDGLKLAYKLGDNASGVAGSIAGGFAGGALAGAALGSVVGPIGTVAGTFVGSLIGCVLATEVYETAIELGAQGAILFAQMASQYADVTIGTIKEYVPDSLDTVTVAFGEYFSSVKNPIARI